MSDDLELKAQICALNNVDWYRAVFASHGLSAEVTDGLYRCHDRVPPYYSNALAFLPVDATAQLKSIDRFAAQLGRRRFTVNDCFARLPLEALGFRTLFDAQWIWRAPDVTGHLPARSQWRRVADPRTLADWETAWRKLGSPTDEPVFLPNLLENPRLAFFAAYANGEIVGVCAANRSEHAVGFSNYFTTDQGDDDLLLTAVRQVNLFAPGLPLVGYERDEPMTRAERAGFRTVGPLRVWLFDKS